MNIATLRKKARDGSLEVEHLLQAAAERQPGLADELERLTVEQQWSAKGILPDGSRVVPFAKWAEVAAEYSANDFDGLRELLTKSENAPFVFGLLEHLPTSASISIALEAAEGYLADLVSHREAAFHLASALNLLRSFKRAAPVTAVQARNAQVFLLTLYAHAKTEVERATVLLALRGVGDADALQFVESAEDFAAPWSTTKEVVLRAIRKRIKTDALQPR